MAGEGHDRADFRRRKTSNGLEKKNELVLVLPRIFQQHRVGELSSPIAVSFPSRRSMAAFYHSGALHAAGVRIRATAALLRRRARAPGRRAEAQAAFANR